MKITISDNIKSLINSRKVVSALNGNSLTFLRKLEKYLPNYIFWNDGLMGSFFLYFKNKKNILRIPGFFLLMKLLQQDCNFVIISSHLNDIHKKKFKNGVRFISAPLFIESKCYKKFVNSVEIKYNDIIILGISSPKQEILANYIYKKYRVSIFCLGGALNMFIGYEKRPPIIISKLGFEWIWRLRYDTTRRLIRLIRYLEIFKFDNMVFLYKLKIKSLILK